MAGWQVWDYIFAIIIYLNLEYQQKMTQEVSNQHLLTCLREKDKYKGTQAYIQEALKFNQQVYPLFNSAITSVLLHKTSKPLHQLFALRFFKQILISGNISLLDSLDEAIEQYIVTVAMYNKANKQINRGANYFIEFLGQKKDAESQRIGSSFVLLATELITVFSKWYNKDEEGQITRFVYYVQQLKKEGIALPNENQYNFFKKEDQNKFGQNYSRWLKYMTQIQQKNQQNKQILKDVLNSPKKQVKIENSLNIANNISDKIKVQNDQSNNININKVKESLPNIKSSTKKQQVFRQNQETIVIGNSSIKEQKQKVSDKIIVKQIKNDTSIVGNVLKEVKKEAQQIKIAQEPRKQNIIIENEQNIKLKLKVKKIQQQLSSKNESFAKLQSEILKYKAKLLQSEVSLTNKQKIIKNLEEQRNISVKNPVSEMKPADNMSNQAKIIQTIVQCYKINVLPPRNIDQLLEQNQILQEMVQTTEQLMKKQKQEYRKEINEVKQQNNKLKNAIEKLKESQIQGQSHFPHVNSSLIVIDQTKLQNAKKITENEMNLMKDMIMDTDKKLENERQMINSYSVSHFLRQNKLEVTNQRFRVQNKSKSLKKTQSSKNFYRKEPLNTTNFNMGRTEKFNNTTMQTKLLKIGQGFSQSSNLNKMATVFPFLQGYFPQIPKLCHNFRQFCIKKPDNSVPYYENEELKVCITCYKQKPQQILIQIQNKTLLDKTIKLQCQQNERKCLIGNEIKRLRNRSKVQFVYRKDEVNFNFRFPVISIIVKNHDHNEHALKIPLPLTLIDFIEVIPYTLNKFQKEQKSIKMLAFSKQPHFLLIKKLFPQLTLKQKQSQISLSGSLKLNKSQITIQISQVNSEIITCCYCQENDLESINLSKVILQLIMFLLK